MRFYLTIHLIASKIAIIKVEIIISETVKNYYVLKMSREMQQYQININNDIQNKRNRTQIQNQATSSLADRRRIQQLEWELNLMEGKYTRMKNDYDCAMETINIMYEKVRQYRKVEIDEYYAILNSIKNSKPSVYSNLLRDCNPRLYVHTIDGLDDALEKARRHAL
jgi:hypothetical protein